MRGITCFTTILVAVMLLPSALAWSVRRLEEATAEPFMREPPPFCFVEHGFDYVGHDLRAVSGNYNECCNRCAATPGCQAWSWSNHNRGTCWLKYGRGEIIANPNVKSALFFRGARPTCQVQHDVDYPGNDLARVDGANVGTCCSACRAHPGCRAYSWSGDMGGSCWLKSKVTDVITKPGVKSAQAYPDLTGSCLVVQYNTDYENHDMGSKRSDSYAGCCDLCKATPGCRAYSWSAHDGGTCWFKNKKGNTLYKPGVVSSQVYPNLPECTIQRDTDYYDSDIADMPGKDVSECCSKCRSYGAGCRAFAWSNHNGGWCWLKNAKGRVISKPGVHAGTV